MEKSKHIYYHCTSIRNAINILRNGLGGSEINKGKAYCERIYLTKCHFSDIKHFHSISSGIGYCGEYVAVLEINGGVHKEIYLDNSMTEKDVYVRQTLITPDHIRLKMVLYIRQDYAQIVYYPLFASNRKRIGYLENMNQYKTFRDALYNYTANGIFDSDIINAPLLPKRLRFSTLATLVFCLHVLTMFTYKRICTATGH